VPRCRRTNHETSASMYLIPARLELLKEDAPSILKPKHRHSQSLAIYRVNRVEIAPGILSIQSHSYRINICSGISHPSRPVSTRVSQLQTSTPSMNANTPRKTNMSSLNTPSKTTPRRVLGDIGPNAINTSLTHGTAPHPSEATRAQSPLKQIPALPPQLFLGKENAVREAAYPQGKKRSIHEVDGVEMAESVKAMFGAREPAQSPWKAGLTAAGLQRHTVLYSSNSTRLSRH
jgi:hypothetical protein